MTMTHIETVTVGSGGAASITFFAIPATFTDLVLVVSSRSNRTTGNDWFNLDINGGGVNANITTRRLWGDGSTAYSDTALAIQMPDNASTANTFSNSEIYFPNYANTSYAKSFSINGTRENNGTFGANQINAGLWSLTDAITSISLVMTSPRLALEYSSASLFGITAGSDGIVAVS